MTFTCITHLNEMALTEVIPDVHLSAQSAHFNDRLAQKVVRLARELRPQFSFEIVVFIPTCAVSKMSSATSNGIR